MPNYEIIFSVSVTTLGQRNVMIPVAAATLGEAITLAQTQLVLIQAIQAKQVP